MRLNTGRVLNVFGVSGCSSAVLLSCTVIVEMIFTWPGLEQLMVGAVLFRDYSVVQGFVTYIAVVVLHGNLVAGVALCGADPRLRLKRFDV